MTQVNRNILKEIYKSRPSNVRKYNFGLLLIIGGSKIYSGSPALSALAAFRSGVDMVRILAPKRAANIIASFSPNLVAYPLKGDWLEKRHLNVLMEMTESTRQVACDNVAVVVGGGMGRNKSSQELVLKYLSQISLPVVVDADAIYAVARKPNLFKKKKILFTPHSYEFFVLTGKELADKKLKEKAKIVQDEAYRLETNILLKGAEDIISNGWKTAVNKTGSPYMTKGGCGDVLAGICGALMARGLDPFLAGQAAAYISGRAGEIVAERKREGLLATDIIEAIPEVLH